jgi:RNA polymerase sigma-70 factor (family 1)
MCMKSEKEDITPLLLELREGNVKAFNTLYCLYSRILLANIRGLVKDNEVAKELLQDLFMKIWEYRASIDPEKSFRSFLFTIARNIVYDHFRRISLDKRARIELIASAVATCESVDAIFEYKESNLLVKTAIEKLSPQCKQVYILSKVQGRSHREISGLMGIAISTVNNHMVKANRELRTHILQYDKLYSLLLVDVIISHINK